MREAIENLRAYERSLREAAGAEECFGPAEVRVMADEAARAADLLEALASPPETVGELEKRTEDLLGYCVQVMQLSGNEGYGGIWVCGHDYDEGCAWEVDTPTVRAAWFAIVGMMEVGRG